MKRIPAPCARRCSAETCRSAFLAVRVRAQVADATRGQLERRSDKLRWRLLASRAECRRVEPGNRCEMLLSKRASTSVPDRPTCGSIGPPLLLLLARGVGQVPAHGGTCDIELRGDVIDVDTGAPQPPGRGNARSTAGPGCRGVHPTNLLAARVSDRRVTPAESAREPPPPCVCSSRYAAPQRSRASRSDATRARPASGVSGACASTIAAITFERVASVAL